MDAIVIAPDRLAMAFDHIELVLDGLKVAANIAGIAVLRDQLERDFLTTAANQQRNMRLLHSFGLIYCASYLIILALEGRFFLRPHRPNDLQRLTQQAQTVGGVGIIVPIGAILVLIPSCPNAKIQPRSEEHTSE